MRCIHVFLFIAGIVSSTLWGQENVHQQLYQVFLLEQDGQFERAIHSVQPLTDSKALSRVECGRAWTLLGFAYTEQGQFQRAQNSYEQALRIFEGDTQHIPDYVNALDYFARLYRVTGQQQMARKMWSRAIHIYEQSDDHGGLSRTYTNLAGMAIEQRHIKNAKQSLEKAIAESTLTSEMTDDDHAALSVTEAWIAGIDGEFTQAVHGYGQALELWKLAHGEHHPLTGWGYLLLGRAYAASGQLQDALANIERGLAILNETAGPQSPKYLAGEIIYSQALEQSGMHAAAAKLKTEAELALSNLYRSQCIGCTVSVTTLR
jgi:tetratricopeptide (TPR) repeat protein